jgi:hypothetical protein
VIPLLLLVPWLLSAAARAETVEPPRPYALPFQLRPAVAPNVARLEITLDGHRGGATGVAVATFGRRFEKDVAVIARAAYTLDAPNGASVAGAFGNPILGLIFAPEIDVGMRLAIFGGIALPLGQGEGLDGNDPEVVALGRGRIARASFDNSFFATNYGTLSVGLAWLWLVERFTFQLEATLFFGARARGSSAVDPSVQNLTSAAWIGYSPIDALSIGVALHHQRFLSTPSLVRDGGELHRAQTSVAVAMRGRISGAGLHWNPGISYTHGLDGRMVEDDDHVVTVELLVQY